VLEATDLECERGGRRLFRKRALALGAGSLLRVAGANGSGKTSLLRILCGLLEPAAGEVRWQGRPIGELREEYTRRIVYLGHAPAIKDDLTAAENLRIACTLAGAPASAAGIEGALERFGLGASAAPTRRLSQGQRRRAALARLLLSAQAPLWLLDEPYAALDVAAARTLDELVTAHAARGGAVVFTTHQEVGIPGARVIELDGASRA
jgi:heme exporter protein A